MSKAQKYFITRSVDKIWLIGYPKETLRGARLPSGLDVMQNFVYYHRTLKQAISNSALHVHEQLVPYWIKSRLPIQQKKHIITKIKDLYEEYVKLMKHRTRSNPSDQKKQKNYSDKLAKLFDISVANAEQLIKNNEDREFLRLQQQARTGCIGSVDTKLAAREKRSAERREKIARRATATATATEVIADRQLTSTDEDDEEKALSVTSDEEEPACEVEKSARIGSTPTASQSCRKSIMSPSVSAVLDRTNVSVRKSTMIIASVLNEASCSTSDTILSKSTVHRQRQRRRLEMALQIKENYDTSKSVVHWDGKLLPDVTGCDSGLVDRLPVLLSLLADGTTKLLGVPKLSSGSGQAASDAVEGLLKSWKSDSTVIGMCFDTTAVNTGRLNGVCPLLENALGRNLLWLACRHHMLEVLLSDAFTVCFGPSTGPDILLFKRFRDNWSKLKHHEPKLTQSPRIQVSEDVRTFISTQLALKHPRDDYLEFLSVAGYMVGLDIQLTIRKPGALHRARWMAKAIYSLKIELLFDGNEQEITLTAYELQGLQRFNRFVVGVYIQSWFTARSTADAPVNDILLIQRLHNYDDDKLTTIGLKMMKRHSWYLSQELATLALFSSLLSAAEKTKLVSNIRSERGTHLITELPRSTADLNISRTFFGIAGIDDSFLDEPVETWPDTQSFRDAAQVISHLVCINDVAERGVALMQNFNASTKDEVQMQYLLQVVEKHRKDFANCNRDELLQM